MTWRMIQADCIEAMQAMDEASVDAIVTDPPYGLEFMGKEWDKIRKPTAHPMNSKVGMTHGEPEKGNPWASERSGYGAPKRMPRCRKCGGYPFSGSKVCKCEPPEWDTRTREYALSMQEWHHAWATEALCILKPGGHLLAFGGSRTVHRLVCGLEDAGFEIRDMLCWIYGAGFPKSLNVSVALESLLPADARCACGRHSSRTAPGSPVGYPSSDGSDDAPLPPGEDSDLAPVPSQADARERSHGDRRGDGQAVGRGRIRPVRSVHRSSEDSPHLWEHQEARSRSVGSTPPDMASSTSPDGSTAEHRTADRIPDTSRWDGDSAWDKHIPRCESCGGWYVEPGFGTALKPAWEGITLARKPLTGTVAGNVLEHGTGALNIDGTRIEGEAVHTTRNTALGVMNDDGWEPTPGVFESHPSGRWPANVLLDEEAAGMLDEQSGELHSQDPRTRSNQRSGSFFGGAEHFNSGGFNDTGGASRFFYTAKTSSAERNRGLEHLEAQSVHPPSGDDRVWDIPGSKSTHRANHHPTVKPVDLMQWLCRLITPPAGVILDPFAGSGSTGIAALREGFSFVGIEREPEYVDIARARIIGDAPLFNVESESPSPLRSGRDAE